MPGAINSLNSLLDYDLNGTITRDELCAAQGGNFGLFEDIGPSVDGLITTDRLKDYLLGLVASKGVTRAANLIRALIHGAEKRWAEHQNAEASGMPMKSVTAEDWAETKAPDCTIYVLYR